MLGSLLGSCDLAPDTETKTKTVTVTVTQPAVTVTKTVEKNTFPQACRDVLVAARDREKLMSRYQSEVVSQLQDIPDELSSATTQPERNAVKVKLIAIEQANTEIQVGLYETEEHMKIVQSLCDKAVR